MPAKAVLDVRVTPKTVRVTLASDPGVEAVTRRVAVGLAGEQLLLVGPLTRTGQGRWKGVADDRRTVLVEVLDAEQLAERRRVQLRDSQRRTRARARYGAEPGRRLTGCGTGQAAWRRCPERETSGTRCEACRTWKNEQRRAERARPVKI